MGALVSATSALALLVIMFATEWYGVAGVPDPSAVRPAVSTAENAWHGLTVTRWVLLATIVASVGAVVLHASQRAHGNKTDTSLIVAALGALSAVLLIWRVLIVLPAGNRVIDQKLGAFLGPAVRAGDRVGRYEAIREQRAPGPRGRRGRSAPSAPAPIQATLRRVVFWCLREGGAQEGVCGWRTPCSHHHDR